MKNILKKLPAKFTEKAFTGMGTYQPKMPKAVSAKIEAKKD